MFDYPVFNSDGEKVLCRADGKNSEMLMDISVYKLKKGQEKTFFSENKEFAVLLTEGKVRFLAENVDEVAERSDVFSDLPFCVQISKDFTLKVEALENSEIIVASTLNDKAFPCVVYRKKDIICSVSCEGRWENTAVRDVNTVFDYDNAPFSNLVVGEVLARQGRWWSYIPHYHPQPEVYYYKFAREEGFGACFIGDEAHTIKDGSVGCFPGGKTHVQVTAPGYPMYCCWIIRHLDGDPWLKTRIVDERYAWLEK